MEMKLKIFFSVLIFVINSRTSFGQELSCYYNNYSSSGYTCDLKIINPNGFNNFTGIDGAHLGGMTNEDVRRIISNNGSTTNVPSIICETFKNATRIELRSIGIQSIDENSFRNCKKLEYLDLDANKIEKMDEALFIENLELNELSLLYNQLTTLPANVLKNQRKLLRLGLSVNKISDLPENVFDSLENLDFMGLYGNQIKSLRVGWFEKLEKLTRLNLDSNQIEELPEGVFRSLKKLEKISLDRNDLRIIHADSFGISPNLNEVSLDNNQIYAIDERFIDNTGVQRLNMQNNECRRFDIFDDSPSRELLRNQLQRCFESYKNLIPGEHFYDFCTLL